MSEAASPTRPRAPAVPAVVAPGRRRALIAACFGPLAAAAGCMSIGGRAPARVSFQLHDPGQSKLLARAPLDRVVLVAWSAASAFYDTTSIVYSRSPGALAYYQLASWSERPDEQIGRLFVRRLAGTGVFRDVAAMTGTVHADWLVDLQLEEMLHDDATPPGVARISLFARVVDRAARRTIDTRRLRQQEPLETESAAGAAQAFEAALGRLLDEAVRWVVDLALAGRSAQASGPAMRATSAAAR